MTKMWGRKYLHFIYLVFIPHFFCHSLVGTFFGAKKVPKKTFVKSSSQGAPKGNHERRLAEMSPLPPSPLGFGGQVAAHHLLAHILEQSGVSLLDCF